MNRPALILAGIALLAAALTVALWPSDAPDDGLGVIAEASEEDETRSEAPASEIQQEETQREEVDPSMLGITDALIVTVIDEFKRPVSDVTVAMTSPGELPIWVFDGGRLTDGGGRAIFDREKAISICEESGWEEVIIGVWDWKLRGFKVERKVDIDDLNAVQFELPGIQQILVKLHGFPDGVAPMLSPIEGSANDAMEITGLLQRDGWWRFDEPPLGEAWDLMYARVDVEEGTGLITAEKKIDLPHKIQFTGPSVPGEITKAESTLLEMPVLQGRLVDEKGDPMRIGQNQRYLSMRGYTDGQQLMLQDLRVEYFRGGAFLAWPSGRSESDLAPFAQAVVSLGYIDSIPQTEERQLGLHELQNLWVAWAPETSRREISSPNLRMGRGATIPLPLGQPGVALGDIVLREDAYLVKFRVVNESGEAVAGADIDPELVAEGSTRGMRSEFLDDLETNQNGEAWLMAPSWNLLERTARGRGDETGPVTGLLIEVDSRQYIEHEEVVPFGTREITITLVGGGSITGELTFSEGFSDRLLARFLPAGSSLTADDDLDTDGIRPRRGRDTLRGRQLPEGTVDLTLNWGWSRDWPVYVQRGIPVIAGEETKLTGLPAGPLDQTFRWVEIVMPDNAEDDEAYVVLEAGRGEEYRTQARAKDGVWRFPLPVGTSRWTGTFTTTGFQPVTVTRLGAGRHDLGLQRLSSIVLKPTCGVEGYYESWWLALNIDNPGAITLDRNRSGLTLRVPEAGDFELTWVRRTNDSFEQVGTTKLTVREADLQGGELVIEPPVGW